MPTKFILFIHYIHLLHFSYLFQCHIPYHQRELLCPLQKTNYGYEANNYGFCSSYVVVPKVSVLIFYLNLYWTHLKLQVISFKV